MQSLTEMHRAIMIPVIEALQNVNGTTPYPLADRPKPVLLNRETGAVTLYQRGAPAQRNADGLVRGTLVSLSPHEHAPKVIVAHDSDRPLTDDEIYRIEDHAKLEDNPQIEFGVISKSAVLHPSKTPTS